MKFISESDWPLYHEIRSRIKGATTWTERVRRCMPESRFFPPARQSDLAAVQRALGCEIPGALQELLCESNGIESPYSSLAYSTDRIIEVNQEFRTADRLADRMPFENLFFFGTVSDGDEFAFPLNRDGRFSSAVFIWSHETDDREEYALGLADYIVKYTVELYVPYMKNRGS